MFGRTGQKAQEMHRVALARLTREMEIRAEYERIRLEEGLKKLENQFDAWDSDPSAASQSEARSGAEAEQAPTDESRDQSARDDDARGDDARGDDARGDDARGDDAHRDDAHRDDDREEIERRAEA